MVQTTSIRSNEAKGHIISKVQLKRQLRAALDVVDCSDVTRVSGLSPAQFRDTYAYQSVFSKYYDSESVNDVKRLSDTCVQKWYECEALCKVSNERFLERDFSPRTLCVLERARQIIADCLGYFKPEFMYDRAGWGPGSTSWLKREHRDASFKFDSRPKVTCSFLPFFRAYCRETIWNPGFEVCEHANFMMVPKNAKTFRGIEPQGVEVFFQMSLGRHIRNRMRRLPVDTSTRINLDSQDINRKLAREGSITGKLATLDLSSASALICFMLVRELLPERWFHALNLVRISKTKVRGDIVELNMFSPMGNGYTWELQSLIFYAITRAVSEICNLPDDDIVTGIFGDDIICRTEVAVPLMDTLRELGLKINEDKSYWEGSFRESCGKHYYEGVDVTPFYVRGPMRSSFDVCKVHNRLVEWMELEGYRRESLRGLINLLRSSIAGQPFSKPIPLGLGDVGLITCYRDTRSIPSLRYRRQYIVRRAIEDGGDYTREGFVLEGHIQSASVRFTNAEGGLIKRLFKSTPEMEESSVDAPIDKMRIVDQVFNTWTWPELGVWLA